MEITVRIIKILPAQSGVKRDGSEWEKFFFVGETNEQYKKQICFSAFGRELFEKLDVKLGSTYSISFDVESHEHNGRYYTEVRPWKAVLVSQ